MLVCVRVSWHRPLLRPQYIYISTITHSDTSSDQLAEPGSNLLCIYLCIVGMNPNGMAHTHTPQNARRTGTRTGAPVRHVEPW